jgi:hypothetical protein
MDKDTSFNQDIKLLLSPDGVKKLSENPHYAKAIRAAWEEADYQWEANEMSKVEGVDPWEQMEYTVEDSSRGTRDSHEDFLKERLNFVSEHMKKQMGGKTEIYRQNKLVGDQASQVRHGKVSLPGEAEGVSPQPPQSSGPDVRQGLSPAALKFLDERPHMEMALKNFAIRSKALPKFEEYDQRRAVDKVRDKKLWESKSTKDLAERERVYNDLFERKHAAERVVEEAAEREKINNELLENWKKRYPKEPEAAPVAEKLSRPYKLTAKDTLDLMGESGTKFEFEKPKPKKPSIVDRLRDEGSFSIASTPQSADPSSIDMQKIENAAKGKSFDTRLMGQDFKSWMYEKYPNVIQTLTKRYKGDPFAQGVPQELKPMEKRYLAEGTSPKTPEVPKAGSATSLPNQSTGKITIISGGQTGADRGGLEGARAAGLKTGGTAPRGYRTERGDDTSLKEFGLSEHLSRDWIPRTEANAVNSDATVWFGNTSSPGYIATKRAADKAGKPFLVNPTAERLREFSKGKGTLNVAGNRESKNPGLQNKVASILKEAFGKAEVPKAGGTASSPAGDVQEPMLDAGAQERLGKITSRMPPDKAAEWILNNRGRVHKTYFAHWSPEHRRAVADELRKQINEKWGPDKIGGDPEFKAEVGGSLERAVNSFEKTGSLGGRVGGKLEGRSETRLSAPDNRGDNRTFMSAVEPGPVNRVVRTGRKRDKDFIGMPVDKLKQRFPNLRLDPKIGLKVVSADSGEEPSDSYRAWPQEIGEQLDQEMAGRIRFTPNKDVGAVARAGGVNAIEGNRQDMRHARNKAIQERLGILQSGKTGVTEPLFQSQEPKSTTGIGDATSGYEQKRSIRELMGGESSPESLEQEVRNVNFDSREEGGGGSGFELKDTAEEIKDPEAANRLLLRLANDDPEQLAESVSRVKLYDAGGELRLSLRVRNPGESFREIFFRINPNDTEMYQKLQPVFRNLQANPSFRLPGDPEPPVKPTLKVQDSPAYRSLQTSPQTYRQWQVEPGQGPDPWAPTPTDVSKAGEAFKKLGTGVKRLGGDTAGGGIIDPSETPFYKQTGSQITKAKSQNSYPGHFAERHVVDTAKPVPSSLDAAAKASHLKDIFKAARFMSALEKITDFTKPTGIKSGLKKAVMLLKRSAPSATKLGAKWAPGIFAGSEALHLAKSEKVGVLPGQIDKLQGKPIDVYFDTINKTYWSQDPNDPIRVINYGNKNPVEEGSPIY